MEASSTFKTLIQQIIESNLNFKLEQSPFSAVISLKKSFAKDKSGKILPSSPINTTTLYRVREENQILNRKVIFLENVINTLKTDFEKAVDECEEVRKVKDQLDRIAQLHIKVENSDQIRELEKGNEFDKVVDQNKNYRTEIKVSTLNTKN